MDRSEVELRVKKVIARVLHVDPVGISPEANFIFDLGADSMQSLELVAALEEEFGITMNEDEALNVQTVSASVDFIKATVDAQEHA